MVEEARRLTDLRDRMIREITARIPDAYLNGHPTERLPHNVNISYAYVEGESLLMGLKEIALSSGSACTSASLEPSYVLKSLGVGDELAHSSIRYGLGRFNTVEEVDYVIEHTVETVNRLREMSPLWELAQEGVDLKSVVWSP
jgi:cysteine desulfurase